MAAGGCAPQIVHPPGLAVITGSGRSPWHHERMVRPPEDRRSSRRRRLPVGVAPVSVCRGPAHRESLPASAAGSLRRARCPTAPGRRGYPHQPGATGKALRLARRAGGRAAGDDDPLAPRRPEIALANEVPGRSAADPDGTARADPQDGQGERVVGEERIANELLLKLGIRISPRTVRKHAALLTFAYHRNRPRAAHQLYGTSDGRRLTPVSQLSWSNVSCCRSRH